MESDFSRFQKLRNLHDLEITQELTQSEKKRQFIAQTGSTDHYLVGDYKVECRFGDMSLEKILSDVICG